MRWARGLLAFLTVCVTGSFAAEPQPTTRPAKVYGVGVVGNCCTHGTGLVGMFSRDPRTRVIAAFEADPRRAEELQATLGRPLAGSYDEVIRHPEVEIVAIACDPCDKADMAEKAAAAGKPIFLNKPFCDSLDNARRIAAAVERHEVWLVHDIPMVRSIPVFARLLDEVRAGRYGQVLGYHHLFGMTFDPTFDLKASWPERLDPAAKSGGGELTNMGCYAIEYAVALFGRPRSVSAKWRKTWDVYRDADVENFGQIVLDYGDFFAFLEAGKQQLIGEHSRLMNAITISFEHHVLHIDAAAQQVSVNHIARDFSRFAEGTNAIGSLDQLLAAIEQGTPPSADAKTAVTATEVLMAAYESILKDSRPVSLPLASGANPLVARRRQQ